MTNSEGIDNNGGGSGGGEAAVVGTQDNDAVTTDDTTTATKTTTTNTNIIRMNDYSYDLKEDSIAKYPAYPRGTSKLVRVDGNGTMHWYNNDGNHFGSVFDTLVKDCLMIFNDSRVLDARLFVTIGEKEATKANDDQP